MVTHFLGQYQFSKFDAHSEGLNGLLHVATTYSVGRMDFYMLQQPIRWSEWSFACCNNPFGGQNGLLHVATTHSVGRMVFCMLQQPIRWAEWSFTCCNNLFGGQNGLLHVATQFRMRANLCCIVETTLPLWPNGCFPNIPSMCYKQMER